MMIRPMILMVLLFDNKGKPTKCEECLSFPWPWSPAAPSPGFSEPDVGSGPAGPTSTRINAWDSQAGSFQCHNGQTQSNLYLAKSLHPSVFFHKFPESIHVYYCWYPFWSIFYSVVLLRWRMWFGDMTTPSSNLATMSCPTTRNFPLINSASLSM